jgi:hypothetical protein
MAASQCVIIGHADTDNLHAHIVSNRVAPNGRAASTSHDFVKAERCVAEIAFQRGWAVVSGIWNQDIVERQRRAAPTICDDNAKPKGRPERRQKGKQFDRLSRTGDVTWSDIKRPIILAAITEAASWDDLKLRLATHKIVLKHKLKVGRSGEFHGLAFAENHDDDALGCSASAVSPECRYAALANRFGPWPAAQVELVAKFEIDKSSGPSRISGETKARKTAPSHAADSAQAASKLKSRYEAYVADFRRARRDERDSDWQRAWNTEQDQRRAEIAKLYSRRNENKRYARATSRDPAATAIILFIIDAAYNWLIKRARQRARERWLATKMEMGKHSAGHPCRYAEWITERAAEGDAAAAREKAILASARRSAHRLAPAANQRIERTPEVKPYRPTRPQPHGFER